MLDGFEGSGLVHILIDRLEDVAAAVGKGSKVFLVLFAHQIASIVVFRLEETLLS